MARRPVLAGDMQRSRVSSFTVFWPHSLKDDYALITSTLSQRKNWAPQPSITWGGQPARGVGGGGYRHDNDDMNMTPQGWLDVQFRTA